MSALDKSREWVTTTLNHLPDENARETISSLLSNGKIVEALQECMDEGTFWMGKFDEHGTSCYCQLGRAIQDLRELELMNYVPKSEIK